MMCKSRLDNKQVRSVGWEAKYYDVLQTTHYTRVFEQERVS